MRTVPLTKLLSSMQSGTALLGLCFTPHRLDVAITTRNLLQPKMVSQPASMDADGLLRLVKEQQVGALLLGGSALFRTNGLTQFGARHIVSRVGGDPFSNTGEAEDSVQLPIALWTKPGNDAVKMIADFLQP